MSAAGALCFLLWRYKVTVASGDVTCVGNIIFVVDDTSEYTLEEMTVVHFCVSLRD